MAVTDEQFAEMANPHSWFLVADNLHAQAIEIKKNTGNSTLTRTNKQDEPELIRDAINRSVFLLAGFALENIIKAYLVYENPGWISNGTLAKKLRSHSLTDLAGLSKLIPHKTDGKKILKGFEDGLDSWARYPCSLSKEDTKDEEELTQKLWEEYKWLISAYSERLKELLEKNWRGPHGFEGHYKFEGNFFSFD